MKKFYITTTLPYVNAPPHLGFALELTEADVIARVRRMAGYEVFFNTGTDEHGLKIYRRALEAGVEPQAYVDKLAEKFRDLGRVLGVADANFIRTTDAGHVKAAQEFWKICAKNGYIEKKRYKAKYCVGCELEKTDSELENGRCPFHPALELEIIEEENYFFRFSVFQKPLLRLYEKYPDFVLPAERFNEIKKFVERGPRDFSVSRLKAKMPWGVPVPGDELHTMYVWFDALVNYVSALGWPENKKKFSAFWGSKARPRAVQIAGKDNLRQQAAMWQAMLLAAGLPTSRQILIHGFITAEGEKMSKSAGNAADPFFLAGKYGTDALRYWLLHEVPAFMDGDFSERKFRERYQGDLANGLGNFAARVLALGASAGEFRAGLGPGREVALRVRRARGTVGEETGAFRFHEALRAIWGLIGFGDEYAQKTAPWNLAGGKKEQAVFDLIVILDNVAALLLPFLPGTSAKITACINWDGKLAIKKGGILFPRLR